MLFMLIMERRLAKGHMEANTSVIAICEIMPHYGLCVHISMPEYGSI